jgi:hypothetical protein
MQWASDAKADGATELEIRLAGDMNLVADDPEHPFLSFDAAKVVIKPKEPGERPTITLSHRSPSSQSQPWAALALSGGNVSVEGVRFVVAAGGGNYKMVGLLFSGRGRYEVRDCEFVQVMPSFDARERVASIRAENAGGRASLTLEECCFLGYKDVEAVSRPGMGQPAGIQPFHVERGGQDAVVRHGAVHVKAVNCAFGPHAAAFRFEEAPAAAEGRAAEIRHCSILAAPESAAFDLAERASADLHVEACLFSRPAEAVSGMGGGSRAVLIRQAAPAGSPPVVFSGKDNRYHNLDDAWLSADGPPAIEWGDDFSRKLQEAGGSDKGSLVMAESPWDSAQPLKQLEQPSPARPGEAFRPAAAAADLRVPGPDGQETVAGVERLSGDDFTTGLDQPPAQSKPSVLGRTNGSSTRA